MRIGLDHLLRERRLELRRPRRCTIITAYGDLSVQDILVKSSNIGAAKLALSVGDQKFYEYIRRFGFGERTGVELPGRNPRTDSSAAICGARFPSRACRWDTKSGSRRCK